MSLSAAAPQWLVELRGRRRPAGGAEPQSRGRRGPADMLLRPLDDEELAYGPGIVGKLRSRYISLTLREAKPRPALPGLRRAASLEHLLDEELPDLPGHEPGHGEPRPPHRARPFQPRPAQPRPARYRPAGRAPEAAKRARSVDALVRCDSRSDDEPPPPPAPAPAPLLAPAPTPAPPSTTASPERVLRPKRPSPLVKEAERPPTDYVKSALMIFENRPLKRTKTPTQTGQVADKVKSFMAQRAKAKTPTANGRLPKPAVPPRSPLLSPEARGFPVGTQTTPSLAAKRSPAPSRTSPEPPPPPLPVSPEPAPAEARPPPPPLVDEVAIGAALGPPPDEAPLARRTSTPEPDGATAPAESELSLISPRSPIRDEVDMSESSEDGSYDVVVDVADASPTFRPISKPALEGVSKAGTTVQFSFGDANGSAKTNGDAKKSHLPKSRPPAVDRRRPASSDEESFEDVPYAFAKNPFVGEKETFVEAKAKLSPLSPLPPLVIPNYSPVEPPRLASPERSPAAVEVLAIAEKTPAGGRLTSREIEKNLINRTKSLERPAPKAAASALDSIGAAAAAAAPPTVVEAEVRAPRKAPRREPQQNTMVFKFTDRKEVPDYVENDGIVLRTCLRDRPKTNRDKISLTGMGGESCTDSSDECDDVDSSDWAVWAAGPPSPCDVVFENDNVVINGRSNIVKPNSKPKKLKIKFDDSLTRTFEYPSESSMIEEPNAAINSSTPISPLALGGSLSTYTPSKVMLQADTFQLGVTKNTSPTTNGQKMDIDEISPTNGDIESHNWSHETHNGSGDLLF